MIGERTGDRDALVHRYGLSQRLAARVVALLARKVAVSPAVLEIAALRPELEAVLLDPTLVDSPPCIEQDHIRGQARLHGFEDSELLRVVDEQEGWRTIALEDDVLAGQAEAEYGSLAGTELVRAEPGGISRLETDELFTPEEMARLKLAALTSQKREERVEALRKLVFAPLADSQKAGLFVNVLTDPTADPDVRREAVRSLEQIGLRPELADAVRRLFGADEAEVTYALRRLGALLEDAGEAEMGVALAVMVELFNEAEDPKILSELLTLITRAAAVLVKSVEKTEQFVQSALRHLARQFEELRHGVEDAFLACHAESPQVLTDHLWKEIGRCDDAAVRSFLIHFSTGTTADPERRTELAAMAVREIVNPALLERERATLRYGLVRLGESAARPVIDRLRGRSGRECAELIRLLDVVCTEGDVSAQAVNEAVAVLLDQLRVGEPTSRRLILEANICADPRVEQRLQTVLAVELLAHISEFRLPSTAEAIYRTLERIGPAAVRPLLDFVVKRYPHPDADQAFEGLGKIAQAHGDAVPQDVWHEVFDYAVALFDDPATTRGGFTIALACMCGYTSAGAKVFDRILKAMTQRVWKVRYTFELFDALGILAGSPNARARHQQILFEMFDEIVHKKGPDRIGVRRMTAGGPVYEFGAEALFDTRVVPAVVRGLDRICSSPQASKRLRREIVKRLLNLWEGVTSVRVVWSPASVAALVRAMCSAACSQQVPADVRVRIGRSLLRFLNKLSVVRSLGEICSQPVAHRSMQELCMDAGEEMLHEWEDCDQQDGERRIALLESMGKLAANTGMKRESHRVKRLRDNVVDALFRALRESVDQARAPLELLRDCPDLPEAQRQEIRDRLSRYLGIVRVGR